MEVVDPGGLWTTDTSLLTSRLIPVAGGLCRNPKTSIQTAAHPDLGRFRYTLT